MYSDWYPETPNLFSFWPACPSEQPTGWTVRDSPYSANRVPPNSCPLYSGCFLTKSPLPDSYDCECFSGFAKTLFVDGTRDDSYPNYIATASTSDTGHAADLAYDGLRNTCWKPTRLDNVARVGEWQSALRVTFPDNGNGVSNTIVGGVKVYTNYWSTYLRDYEHMEVKVCEWVPGQEFTNPASGDDVNEIYSPEESELLEHANLTGYKDGYCGHSGLNYTKTPLEPGWFEWYEGHYDDWLCGRTNRDLFDGLTNCVSCGWVEYVDVDYEANESPIHFSCPSNVTGNVVQIVSQDATSFYGTSGGHLGGSFDFEICEVELIPKMSCDLPDMVCGCDPDYPAVCTMEDNYPLRGNVTWVHGYVDGSTMFLDQLVESASCDPGSSFTCDCGNNRLDQSSATCGTYPNYEPCDGTLDEPCQDKDECHEAYNGYYRSVEWHGQGWFNNTGSPTGAVNGDEYPVMAFDDPPVTEHNKTFYSLLDLEVVVYGDHNTSDFTNMFDGDEHTSMAFDSPVVPDDFSHGIRVTFDGKYDPRGAVLLDRVEIVLDQSAWASMNHGVNWTYHSNYTEQATFTQESICIYTNDQNTGVFTDWSNQAFVESEKFSCIDYGSSTSYESLNSGEYWRTYVLDNLHNFRVTNEIFIAVNEPSIKIAELYLYWKECNQVKHINPNYPLGTEKNGLMLGNGFCIPCPDLPSTYEIIEEGNFLDPPAISDESEKRRFFEYMLLRKSSGFFETKSEAKAACESVGMNLVVPLNYKQNEFWKGKVALANRGIILGISWVADGWYIHDSNKEITFNDFTGVDLSNTSPEKVYYISDQPNSWQEYDSPHINELYCHLSSTPKIDCKHYFACENSPKDFTCPGIPQCTEAAVGADGLWSCDNVDECEDGLHNCDTTSECVDMPYGYECKCVDDGWMQTLDFNGTKCIDIDECDQDLHNCDDTASCVNYDYPAELNSYECKCEPDELMSWNWATSLWECFGCPCGTICNAPLCQTEDDCDPDPAALCTVNCTELGTGYYCPSENLDDCDQFSNCAFNCTTVGPEWSCPLELCRSPKCCLFECPAGTLCPTPFCNSTAECIDICNDTVNANCGCPAGYNCPSENCATLEDCEVVCPEGTGCWFGQCEKPADCLPPICKPITCPYCGNYAHCVINEVTNNASCECNTGFAFDNNGVCIDDLECDNMMEQICWIMGEDCVNTLGSYYCKCPDGYDRNNVTTECDIDIDECSTDTHNCDINAHCTNFDGGYDCTCNVEYIGNGFYCIETNECPDDPDTNDDCQPGDPDCCHDCCENGDHDCGNDQNCLPTLTLGRPTCKCQDGYVSDVVDGTLICTDIDECDPAENITIPCETNDCCVNTNGSYYCSCCGGIDCPTCGANAHCTVNVTASNTYCVCNDGYEGDPENECTDINECDDLSISACDTQDPIEDCINNDGSFTCVCPIGYEREPDPPGLICIDINECINRNVSTEPDCDAAVDECNLVMHNCNSQQTCVNSLGSYTCSGDDEDQLCPECPTCGESAFCTVNNVDVPTCKCLAGYYGDPFTKCNDIDECKNNTLNICDENVLELICINSNGSYSCGCPRGYMFEDGTCVDIDECDKNNTSHNCNDFEICHNTLGSFWCEEEPCPTDCGPCVGNAACDSTSNRCECLDGYRGNGTISCEDIDECDEDVHQCDSDRQCINANGSFACGCKSGYNLIDTECVDIDECDVSQNVLNILLYNTSLHNCPTLDICENTIGSYYCEYKCDNVTCPSCGINAHCGVADGNITCICNDGFTGNSPDVGCDDINECDDLVYNSTCLEKVPAEDCFNTPGSFICICPNGYVRDEDNGDCDDINECKNYLLTNCNINQTCVNSIGSYSCSGNDTDELCPECPDCGVNAYCIIDDNDAPSCKCLQGYDGDAFTGCDDIDECNTQNVKADVCPGPFDVCLNTNGSFWCLCENGYYNNGTACEDVDECDAGTHDCNIVASCVNIPGGYNCTCPDNYLGNGLYCFNETDCPDPNGDDCPDCCEDGAHTCGNNESCLPTLDLFGGSMCACREGFQGSPPNCIDINECDPASNTPNITTHACQSNDCCVNTIGSYYCKCCDGPECPTCGTNAHCTLTDSIPTCVCNDGFEGDADNGCTDINECLNHTLSSCHNLDQCMKSILFIGYVFSSLRTYFLGQTGL